MTSTTGNVQRLTVLATHPIQYLAPLFRELSQRPSLHVHVIYLTDSGARRQTDAGFGTNVAWDVPLLDGYAHEILRPGTEIGRLSPLARHAPGLLAALQRSQPNFLLIFGYASRMNWQAVHWAHRSGVRVFYLSDSNGRLPSNPYKSWLKQPVLRYFYSLVDRFLCPGEANYAYLTRYGARPERILRYPFSIDAQRFSPSAREPEPSVDFIWAGKLIARKRPLDFIEALSRLGHKGLQVKARLVGSGPLEGEVKRRAAPLEADGVLELRGFVNQSKMPEELHAARIFVFTSESEPYGLAVTEAAAAHLPIIATDINGCVGAWGSGQPGRNTVTYPAGDVERLTAAMEQVLTDRELYERLRQESGRIGREHDSKAAADVLERAMGAGAQRT